jgi:poly-gamma-glutamate capsule biosynthesis protein CapA/YwtB (metallophosphatase superfamily)
MLSGKVGEKQSTKRAGYPFEYIKDILVPADINIGNLECSLSDREAPIHIRNKTFNLRGSPEFCKSLADAGFNIISLANNHILDYGAGGLIDTIDNLQKEGIHHIGAGKDLEEASKPLIIEMKGLRLAFLAFTYAFRARYKKPGCAPCNFSFIQRQIRRVRSSVDVVIVNVHQGIEYVDFPSRKTVALYRGIADEGADLILGHHPHVVQGVEFYNNSLIVYSLGNFVSSYYDSEVRRTSYNKTALFYYTDHPPALNDLRTTESFILHCSVAAKGLRDYELIPVKSDFEFQPVLMNLAESRVFFQRIEDISAKLSNLADPVWDDMDRLWDICERENLKSETLVSILKKIHHLRFRHMRLVIPFLKAKLKGEQSA